MALPFRGGYRVMAQNKQTLFKKIPAVDRLLLSPTVSEVSAIYPRDLILKAVNQVLDELRTRIQKGEDVEDQSELSIDALSNRIVSRLELISRPSLRPVINATGVVIHTNLGRSILPEKVLQNLGPLRAVTAIWNMTWIRGKGGADILMWKGS